MDDLDDTRDQLLCSAFPDPDSPNPMIPDMLGPLLSLGDCNLIAGHLNQIRLKQGVCHDAQLEEPQGNSNENCNAYFTLVMEFHVYYLH